MNELISFLENQDVEYSGNKKLSECTSIGIGGAAEIFVSPNSKEKFTETVLFLHREKIPYRIIGNLTNILPADDRIKTVLVSTLGLNRYSITESSVLGEAGVLFSSLIRAAEKCSLGGYESLFGIPGTVGAMIAMNAGAFGSAISDHLDFVTVLSPADECILTLKRDDIAFFYRDSEIKRQGFIVLEASFCFNRSDRREISRKIREIIKKRTDSHPTDKRSLGSVFKRSEKLTASYMIDRIGLKGMRCGGVSVSQKHAGFFVNDGGATASDFLKLTKLVKSEVDKKYGVKLEEEFEYLS